MKKKKTYHMPKRCQCLLGILITPLVLPSSLAVIVIDRWWMLENKCVI